MVKELIKKDKTYYLCDSCGFAYEERRLAAKCQAWCEMNNSCNMEITRRAVKV